MQVSCVRDPQSVSSFLPAWQAWTDRRTMQTPAWCMAWWESFAAADPAVDRELYLVVVSDALGSPRGILPLYRESPRAWSPFSTPSRTLRLLGDGVVSSDHLSILCDPGFEPLVIDALAGWLMDAGQAAEWDVMQLEGIDADDPTFELLMNRLRAGGCWLDERPDQSTWALDLPETWDEYLANLSKNQRKRYRRLWKSYFATQRVTHHDVETVEQLPHALNLLIRLHESRRAELGDAGVFHGAFRQFHETLLPHYLAENRARISWVELDGRPVAAEYQLLCDDEVWCYQSGMDPEATEHGPGNLSTLACILWAIEHGYRRFDFLRGDEPYKQYWGATPRSAKRVMIRPARWDAGIWHTVQRTGHHAKRALRAMWSP